MNNNIKAYEAMSMDQNKHEIERAFKTYNKAMNKAEGIYVPGLIEADIIMAIINPETTFLADSRIPVVVPAAANSWISMGYFERKLGGQTQRTFDYYAGSKDLAVQAGVAHVEMARQALVATRKRGASLILEQSVERDVMPDFMEAAREMGYRLENPLQRAIEHDEFGTEHYIYACEYEGGSDDQLPQLNMYDAYNKRIGDDSPTRLRETLTNQEIEQAYPHYLEAFKKLIEVDPFAPVFSETEFAHMMKDPYTLKFTHYDDKGIVGICLAYSVQEAVWMSQPAIKARYPEKFEKDHVLFCPGIYARPGAAWGSSLHTLGLAAKTFAAANIDPAVIIECGSVSNAYIPRIFERSVKRAGVSSLTVGTPVVEQSVAVLEVAQ